MKLLIRNGLYNDSSPTIPEGLVDRESLVYTIDMKLETGLTKINQFRKNKQIK